ncbi:uncharacterized protein LJ264_001777 isoform 1-T1 [Porphyrio hochstetteri]
MGRSSFPVIFNHKSLMQISKIHRLSKRRLLPRKAKPTDIFPRPPSTLANRSYAACIRTKTRQRQGGGGGKGVRAPRLPRELWQPLTGRIPARTAGGTRVPGQGKHGGGCSPRRPRSGRPSHGIIPKLEPRQAGCSDRCLHTEPRTHTHTAGRSRVPRPPGSPKEKITYIYVYWWKAKKQCVCTFRIMSGAGALAA